MTMALGFCRPTVHRPHRVSTRKQLQPRDSRNRFGCEERFSSPSGMKEREICRCHRYPRRPLPGCHPGSARRREPGNHPEVEARLWWASEEPLWEVVQLVAVR
jgi:hypothetical protein